MVAKKGVCDSMCRCAKNSIVLIESQIMTIPRGSCCQAATRGEDDDNDSYFYSGPQPMMIVRCVAKAARNENKKIMMCNQMWSARHGKDAR